MNDFTVDELIEMYILLDSTVRANIDDLDYGGLDSVSRNELLKRNALYNGMKRKLTKILKSVGVDSIKFAKEVP